MVLYLFTGTVVQLHGLVKSQLKLFSEIPLDACQRRRCASQLASDENYVWCHK